jgi:hypothetical protein
MLSRDVARLIAAGLLSLAAGTAAAQTQQSPITPDSRPSPNAAARAPPASRPDCPPGVDPDRAPTLGGPSGTTGSGDNSSGDSLSSRLSYSRGVVCPPAGIDPDIVEPPPAGGVLNVVPPPGTPGGAPSPTPK